MALGKDGERHFLHQAKFSADPNSSQNINAGHHDRRFFLTTGGPTNNTGTPL